MQTHREKYSTKSNLMQMMLLTRDKTFALQTRIMSLRKWSSSLSSKLLTDIINRCIWRPNEWSSCHVRSTRGQIQRTAGSASCAMPPHDAAIHLPPSLALSLFPVTLSPLSVMGPIFDYIMRRVMLRSGSRRRHLFDHIHSFIPCRQ